MTSRVVRYEWKIRKNSIGRRHCLQADDFLKTWSSLYDVYLVLLFDKDIVHRAMEAHPESSMSTLPEIFLLKLLPTSKFSDQTSPTACPSSGGPSSQKPPPRPPTHSPLAASSTPNHLPSPPSPHHRPSSPPRTWPAYPPGRPLPQNPSPWSPYSSKLSAWCTQPLQGSFVDVSWEPAVRGRE